jgi:transcriptional pleiotropic regulator of transition state genes
MKSTGMVRRVDELGRIVLPIEIRKVLDIKVKDHIEIFMDDGRIVLQKCQPFCIFCGNGENIVYFGGKRVCSECIEKLKEQL